MQWKACEKKQMEEENRKILECVQQNEAREEVRKSIKKEQAAAIAAVQDKLASHIREKMTQAEEMERCVCVYIHVLPGLFGGVRLHYWELWVVSKGCRENF